MIDKNIWYDKYIIQNFQGMREKSENKIQSDTAMLDGQIGIKIAKLQQLKYLRDWNKIKKNSSNKNNNKHKKQLQQSRKKDLHLTIIEINIQREKSIKLM